MPKQTQPTPWLANGHQVQCPVCKGTQFAESKAQLNTAAMSLFDLDFLNKTATLLVCPDCSHIQWFGDKTKLKTSHNR